MLTFLAIAVAAFLLVAGSFLFGHDHDVDHDHDHDAGHGGGEHTISVFSIKVICTFLMGFGAAGAIGMNYGLGYMESSMLGVVAGLVLGGAMFGFLNLISKQQASSIIATESLVGASGVVTVSIGEKDAGEVGVTSAGRYMNFTAMSAGGKALPKGKTIRVVKTVGSQLIVEEA